MRKFLDLTLCIFLFLDLSAPLEVLVDKLTSSSVQLSWKPPPPPKGENLKLFTYTLMLTPITRYGHGKTLFY